MTRAVSIGLFVFGGGLWLFALGFGYIGAFTDSGGAWDACMVSILGGLVSIAAGIFVRLGGDL